MFSRQISQVWQTPISMAVAMAYMNRFARDVGILKSDVPYEKVVATQFSPLWKG